MGSRANRPHYPEAGTAAVVMAKDLKPGAQLGRTRVVESVEEAPGGGWLHVRFEGGRMATYAPTQRLLVYRPEIDWKAIAEQYRELVLDVGSPDPAPANQWWAVPAYWLAARRDQEAEWPS